jgi:hypothetical protein
MELDNLGSFKLDEDDIAMIQSPSQLDDLKDVRQNKRTVSFSTSINNNEKDFLFELLNQDSSLIDDFEDPILTKNNSDNLIYVKFTSKEAYTSKTFDEEYYEEMGVISSKIEDDLGDDVNFNY